MSSRPLRGSGSARRAREAARRASARRRRTGWITAVILLVAVVGTVLGLHLRAGPSSTAATPTAAVGHPAPGGQFTTVSGQPVDVASLRGHPTLLWFVATWCSSCQTGVKAVAANIDRFAAAGTRVVTLELADNLGQSGPSIDQFGRQLAGPAYRNPNWQFGTASQALTRSYDPKAYLDIYYLLDRDGNVVYVNGSPGSTMPNLLAEVAKLA